MPRRDERWRWERQGNVVMWDGDGDGDGDGSGMDSVVFGFGSRSNTRLARWVNWCGEASCADKLSERAAAFTRTSLGAGGREGQSLGAHRVEACLTAATEFAQLRHFTAMAG